MKILKITLQSRFMGKFEGYCAEDKSQEFIKTVVDALEYPYFLEAYKEGGYFRGETEELPHKVQAYILTEELFVFGLK